MKSDFPKTFSGVTTRALFRFGGRGRQVDVDFNNDFIPARFAHLRPADCPWSFAG
jgi:hypothetical protein